MDVSSFWASRISRDHFWVYLAAVIWVGLAWGIFQSLIESKDLVRIIDFLIQAMTTIFGVIITIGRMHDVNKSGWFAFLPIYNIVVPIATKGDTQENRFGPPPRELPKAVTKTAAGLLLIAFFLIIATVLLLLSA